MIFTTALKVDVNLADFALNFTRASGVVAVRVDFVVIKFRLVVQCDDVNRNNVRAEICGQFIFQNDARAVKDFFTVQRGDNTEFEKMFRVTPAVPPLLKRPSLKTLFSLRGV